MLMRIITLIHRWVGALMGIVLVVLGLSGAVLVHKDAWTSVPHKYDVVERNAQHIGTFVTHVMNAEGKSPQMIVFASPSLGVNRLAHADGRGEYADQTGHVLVSWTSDWSRPELWLVTLHRYLFMRPQGETYVGVAGLIGILMVITGSVLWWRTRKTFEFRLWPKRFSRPAIIRHHRDLGIIIAPLLLLSFMTGVLMVFRPLGGIAFGPGTSAALTHSLKPPVYPHVKMGRDLNWVSMMETAQQQFPEAEFRSLALPRKESGLITLRMRQPDEWLPNGRTMLWFAADTGHLIEARDARIMSLQARLFNDVFPVHAAKIGGLFYRIVMTLSGVGLVLLGVFAIWTFWTAGNKKEAKKPKHKPA
ncbi:PepSY-associated TM helix domain-containing protein [Acetobacter tropicalis]|nr:PepSY-associated TM helix domain-containing protein [Acetobacter tropicalis]